MKLAKLFLDEFEFGTHMVSEDTWNGWSIPYIKDADMESFANRIKEVFLGEYDEYDLLEKVDGDWVWNNYHMSEKNDGSYELEYTYKFAKFEKDGILYHNIQIGHVWEHEEVA